ncbi:MAG TPA: nuclear transport factor 2 family protein, partial [Acidimicrobiales bacterium]|nr:nuclear transport factor 2 family protein [Acidimicrobiales bacterium]
MEQAQATRRDLGPLDDDAHAVAADAADRLGRAARRALDRDDLLAAAGLADRAVNCLDPDDQARAELLLTRCEALLGAGDVAAAGPAVDELSRLAVGSARLEAWATCFDVQRTSLVDSRALADVEARLTDAAAQLSDAGDSAGAAKAHRVHASVLARLGRVGDCEAALDRALGAARDAGDRRQTTSVLSAAPLAALWGPSPVPRAGGRCLDVIRLVRITTGAPAVEATSIRCQAVLEAFRGRLDAARSLIASARAIAEELGLRHGLLEVELFAGIVELCGDDAAAAEEHLRRAHEGFTAMGITTDAAQAAALRGRASLALGRADDALAFATTSEELGGQDLKTSIAWRAVKAEVLAARGNITEATELAQAAVDVAKRTDALVDHADALAALAGVLRAAGDSPRAQQTSADARALYEQKGATALAERLPAFAPTAPASGHEIDPRPPERSGVGDDDLDSRATRVMAEFNRAFLAGEIEELSRFFSPALVYEDRRPSIMTRVEGPADSLGMFRVLGELGIREVQNQVVAIRGDHLAVYVSVWRGEFEVPLVIVSRVDAQGLIELGVSYEVADLPTALEYLDELYAAELPPQQVQCLATTSAVMDAHRRRDWDAFRQVFSADVRVVSHSRAGGSEIVGVDNFIDYARSMVELAPDYFIVVRQILAIDERCVLGKTMSYLTGEAGGTYESPRLLVSRIGDDGRMELRESFDPEQVDEAWARYRELADGNDSRMAQYRRAFELAMAGRFDELAQWLSPDYVYDDRREGLGNVVRGRDSGVEHFRAIAAVRPTRLDIEELATRGERLALLRRRIHADGLYADFLWIHGTDEHGKHNLAVAFDPVDVRVAFEELDALYIAGEGAAHAEGLQLITDFLHSYNTRDWDGVRGLYTDDIVTVDHRPTGFGVQRGVDEVIARHRSLAEVVPDATLVIPSYQAMGPRCWIMDMRTFAPRPGADPYELESVTLAELHPAARAISRLEHFTTVDQAWARHRELTAAPTEAGWGNAASRVSQRVLDAIVEGHIDDLTSLISPTAVTEDRRLGMTSRVEGYDQFRALAGLGITSIDNDVKAVRGERLMLSESVWRGDFEVRVLTLVQLDEHGRIEFSLLYEPDQLVQALEDLDEQYVAGEGARLAAQLGYVRDFTRRYNARDWDGLRAFYTADIVSIDHRPAGAGAQHGAHEVIARHRALGDLAPDATLVIPQICEMGERFWLAEMRTLLPGHDGQVNELHGFVVEEVVSPAGPMSRIEYFATLDEARARYDELATTAPPDGENAALAMFRRWCDAMLAGDLAAIDTVIHPDFVLDDRRPMFGSRLEGRQAAYEWFAATRALGLTGITLKPLAFRGDRLVLTRRIWHVGDNELN